MGEVRCEERRLRFVDRGEREVRDEMSILCIYHPSILRPKAEMLYRHALMEAAPESWRSALSVHRRLSWLLY